MGCKNVILVEDEIAISSMMKDILELQGYKVFLAGDGAEGIKVLRELHPAPCIVLLDLMMPGTNGWQFLDVQRNDPALKHVPVLVCSAYAESAKAVKPHAYIPKPVQLENLIGTVKKFCA